VHVHLAKLEQAGYIRRDPTKPRALELVGRDGAGESRGGEVHVLPLVGEIAAGSPLLAEQNIEDYVSVPAPLAKGEDEFLLRVRGESMIEVGIMPGDYVVVRRQQTATNGDVVAAIVGNDEAASEATVKTFYREDNRIRLQPENAALEPLYPDHVQILGKIVGLFRRL
jgi:repressor LexA